MKSYATLLLAAALVATCGCTRTFWRRQADWDAYQLIGEKNNHPHWELNRYNIAIDPRSRMFDPYCADCPPMPPDDPVAHEYMHCVDNKRGWPFWHDHGDTPNVENATWPAYLEFDDRGVLVVGADDAVRIGLLNSRDYQSQLETLYLSALDVSFERFRFQTQGFAGYQDFFTADGRLRIGTPRQTGVGGDSRSLFELGTFSKGQRGTGFSLQKAYSTGSTLVVGFANSLVWQFSGPDDYSGLTLLDFALFQPLLRNAGRDRILERLTVSERTLLYNVRSMERYRQSFNLAIMTGRATAAGPNRRGGVFGSGLEGFTGVGGGFGNVATTGGGTGAGGGGAAGAGAADVNGYMGLLQNIQQIRNQEDNVERLRSNLYRLEEFLNELRTRSGEVGLVNNVLRQDLQVAQARQALYNAESTLLNQRNSYESTLDGFKTTLGLPPQVCMDVSDRMLDQFQLIDRVTMQQQRALDQIVGEFGSVRQRIISHIKAENVVDPTDATRTRVVRVLEWYPELEQDLADLKAKIEPIRKIRATLMTDYLPTIEQDLTRFELSLPRRKAWLAKVHDQLVAQKNDLCVLLPVPEVNEEIFRAGRLDESLAYARSQFNALADKVKNQYEAHLNDRSSRIDQILAEGKAWTPQKLFTELYEGVLYPKQSTEPGAEAKVTDILVDLPADILALQLAQARARSEAIELTPVDIKAEQALEVARKYRVDWMNARANLVDSWRLIQFNSDQLQSSLDVFFSGDLTNVGQNPFNFNSNTGRLRMGVQFDAPITRLSERNTYRQSLIEYQQARRAYYNFEDGIARSLRSTLRTVLTNQINFELQRQAVLIAAQQIDRNEDLRIDQELNNQGAGVTAARDAVSALSDLLSAQNNFMSIWVNYEAIRRSLDLDLGTLQLDDQGLWIDPGRIGEDYGKYDPWLWRTGGADCPLPRPNEVTPADVLQEGLPGHTEQLPLPGVALPPPSGGAALPQIEGLPKIEGLPAGEE